jgi:hypothetical protein
MTGVVQELFRWPGKSEGAPARVPLRSSQMRLYRRFDAQLASGGMI